MFKNRFDAAEQLVPYVTSYANNPQATIIAIPRGGLELGYVLARKLHLPLDIILTKKIGHPGSPELAIGAVGLEDMFIDPGYAQIPALKEYIHHETQEIRKTLQGRERLYRNNKPPLNLRNKIVIVVDDGVATGNTLLVTLKLIARHKPAKIIVALPVGPQDALDRLAKVADELICLLIPDDFFSVGQYYQTFAQVDDKEAVRLLTEATT